MCGKEIKSFGFPEILFVVVFKQILLIKWVRLKEGQRKVDGVSIGMCLCCVLRVKWGFHNDQGQRCGTFTFSDMRYSCTCLPTLLIIYYYTYNDLIDYLLPSQKLVFEL